MASMQVPKAENESVLIDYLLGQLGEEATEALDRRSIADDEFAARLGAVEHELVDAYVRGELDPVVRARVEEAYLGSASGREKVELARAMSRTRGHALTAPNPWRRHTAWFSAAAAAVLVAGLAWMTVSRQGERAAGSPAASPTAQTPGPAPAAPLPARALIALSLSPSAVRDSSDAAILLRPTDPATVSLTLLSDGPAEELREPAVVIRAVTGKEVWRGPATRERTRPDGALARVDVETSVLPPDDYIVELRARTPAGVEQQRARYFLRVRAR